MSLSLLLSLALFALLLLLLLAATKFAQIVRFLAALLDYIPADDKQSAPSGRAKEGSCVCVCVGCGARCECEAAWWEGVGGRGGIQPQAESLLVIHFIHGPSQSTSESTIYL